MDILLVDDEARVRSALWLLLRQHASLNVVGEASDLSQALSLMAMRQPDVLILDWDLLGENGKRVTVLEQMRELCSDLQVIALSLRPEARKLALGDGADVFVHKGDMPDHLVEILERLEEKTLETAR